MKKLLLAFVSVMLVVMLVGCGNKVDESTSEKFLKKAEEIVMLLNEEKYDEVHAQFDSQMKAGLSLEQMGQLSPILQQSGNFEKIDKSSIEEKDGYYIVVFVVKYSNENRVFTITFNAQEEIAGLFIN